MRVIELKIFFMSSIVTNKCVSLPFHAWHAFCFNKDRVVCMTAYLSLRSSIMKKIILVVSLVLVSSSLLMAQGRPDGKDRKADFRDRRPVEAVQETEVSLAGTLVLVNGHIGLQSPDKTVLLAGIQGLTGFVEGLKEGAKVSVKGVLFTGGPRMQARQDAGSAKVLPEMIFVKELVIGSRTITIERPFNGMGDASRFGRGPGGDSENDKGRNRQKDGSGNKGGNKYQAF
jgi:hypothetical protein